KLSARKLSEILEGSIVGNPDIMVSKPAKIEEADEDSVSFIAHPKYEQFASASRAGILIVNEQFNYTDDINATLILVKDAYHSFTKILEMFMSSRFDKSGVDDKASVDVSAQLGVDVFVGAFSYISERAVIGNHVKIMPNVFIGENVSIGDNTIIFSGVNIYHD